jgi:ribosomal protein S18
MAAPITYKRLVLSGDKAKATADEVKAKMSKDWKKDFPDGKLDIKSGVEGKMVIDVTTKESSAASLASKIKDIATRNKVTTVTKDKPTLKVVKEALDRRIATVFFKYKGKSFPMDYKPTSLFSKFISDLEESGAFSSDDEVSDFMSSEEFDMYANKFGVEIDYADYDPTPLELAPKEPVNPQDMIPGRAPKDFISADIPHRVTDLMEKLKKTGKLKKSELKEIIKHTKK